MNKYRIATILGWSILTLSGVLMAAMVMGYRAGDPSRTETQVFVLAAPGLVMGVVAAGLGLTLIVLGQRARD